MRKPSLAFAGIGLIGAFVVAGGSGVAIGSAVNPAASGGTISACVHSADGAVRIANSNADCRRAELPLTWPGAPSTPQVQYVKQVVETVAPGSMYGGPVETATVACPDGTRIVSGQRLAHETTTAPTHTSAQDYLDPASNAYVVKHRTGHGAGDNRTTVQLVCIG